MSAYIDRYVDPEDIGAAVALPALRLLQGKGLGALSAPIEGFVSSVASRNLVAMNAMTNSWPEAKPLVGGAIVGVGRLIMGGSGSSLGRFGSGFVDGVTANVIGAGVLGRVSDSIAAPLRITRGPGGS